MDGVRNLRMQPHAQIVEDYKGALKNLKWLELKQALESAYAGYTNSFFAADRASALENLGEAIKQIRFFGAEPDGEILAAYLKARAEAKKAEREASENGDIVHNWTRSGLSVPPEPMRL